MMTEVHVPPPPPALLQPLSLQQSSIYCIVTNLEKYPPDLLALLPLHFRRELLLLLPPADIFQLEQTKVVEGIDMENEIWKMLKLLRRLPLFPASGTKSKSNLPQPIFSKDHFVSCLASFLFCMVPLQLNTVLRNIKHFGHKNYVVLLLMLFCNRLFNLKQLTNVGGFPLQVSDSEVILLRPSRYSRFFNSLVPLSEWVRFLLEDCHIEPPSVIKIDLNQFNIESGTSFQHFLSNAKDVRLFMKFEESSSANQPITEEVLHVLDKFIQLCSLNTQCHQLEKLTIIQNFAARRFSRVTDQSQFNVVLQKCFLHPRFVIADYKPPNLFQSLKCIEIAGYRTEIELSTLFSLFFFAQNHDFQSISVSGPTIRCDEQQKEVIVQALEPTSTTPISSSCRLISLSDMKQIPFSFLFWLMKLFLYSSSTIAQKMVISSCEIDYSVAPSEKEQKSIPEPPNLANSHKCLHLSRLDMEHVLVETFSRLPSLVLDELNIEHSSYAVVDKSHSATTEVLCALLLTLPTIPLCHINSLFVQFDTIRGWRTCVGMSPTLSSSDSKFIGTLFELVQKLPKTAVSLHISLKHNFLEALLTHLCNEWKKNGGTVLLKQVVIQLINLHERPGLQLTLEKSLYPIRKIARDVDIKEKEY